MFDMYMYIYKYMIYIYRWVRWHKSAIAYPFASTRLGSAYICVYIHIYICINICFIYLCVYINIRHTCIGESGGTRAQWHYRSPQHARALHIYVYMYTCICIYKYMFDIFMYICKYTTYIYRGVWWKRSALALLFASIRLGSAYIYIYMYIYVYVYVYIYINICFIYICIYINIRHIYIGESGGTKAQWHYRSPQYARALHIYIYIYIYMYI